MSYSRSPRAERSMTIGTRGIRWTLAVERRHPLRGVAVAQALGQCRGDLGEVLGRQLDIERADVLLETLDAPSAGDRDDVVALREHPGERELRRGHALRRGKLLDLAHQVEVALEALALEAGRRAAEV